MRDTGQSSVEHELTGQAVAELFDTTFDGDGWMVMLSLAAPLEEVAFVAAVEPATVARTNGRPATGLGLMLIETPHGPVLRFTLTLYDDPRAPLELRLPVNPIDGREMVEQLASQETFQVIFFDCRDGRGIGRRILRLEPEIRRGLRLILEHTRELTGDYGSWLAAVRAAAPHL